LLITQLMQDPVSPIIFWLVTTYDHALINTNAFKLL